MNVSRSTKVVEIHIPKPNIAPSTLMYSENKMVHMIIATIAAVVMYKIADTSLESLSPFIFTFRILKAKITPIACRMNLYT